MRRGARKRALQANRDGGSLGQFRGRWNQRLAGRNTRRARLAIERQLLRIGVRRVLSGGMATLAEEAKCQHDDGDTIGTRQHVCPDQNILSRMDALAWAICPSRTWRWVGCRKQVSVPSSVPNWG